MADRLAMPVQAVIMAAGLGTRLRPLTDTTPKPMLLVLNRPILEWTIDALPEEVGEVILVVGYLQEQIKNHFGDSWHGRVIRYVTQNELTGTGTAVHEARKFLQPGRFFVINGDDLYDRSDLQKLGQHQHSMLVMINADTSRFSCVVGNADNLLQQIQEGCKAEHMHLVNTGAYVLDEAYFELPLQSIGKGEFGLPHTVTAAHDRYQTNLVIGSFWFPIGYPADLEQASQALSEHMASSKPVI